MLRLTSVCALMVSRFFYWLIVVISELIFCSFYVITLYFLKVLTNEKRGGLSVVSFDRSPFKLFSLKFSKRLVQAPSCERNKTAPRTLFVSFANNNYFQIAV
jgi:hypothetical protein